MTGMSHTPPPTWSKWTPRYLVVVTTLILLLMLFQIARTGTL